MGPLVIKERFRESGVTAAGMGAVTCHYQPAPPRPERVPAPGRGRQKCDCGVGRPWWRRSGFCSGGKMPLKHKPGANQPRQQWKAAGRSTAPQRAPTFHRRVGVRAVGKHHVHVLQLQPLQRCLQTCNMDGAVRCVEPHAASREADGEAQPGTGASSAWRAPSSLPLPSMMCFRDRPLSVSALEKERWVRAWDESLTHALLEGRCYLLSSPEDFGGDDQAGPSAGRKRESLVVAPAKPRAPCLGWHIPAQGCSTSFPQPIRAMAIVLPNRDGIWLTSTLSS